MMRAVYLAALLCCALPGCRSRGEAPMPPEPSAQAPKPPIDRLAPGELAASGATAFGMPVPKGMQLTHKFHDVAYIEGNVGRDPLIDFVKQHIGAERAELAENAVIFPRVTINGQPDRIYDIEVFSKHGRSKLTIRDVTPVPAPQGLTESQRWERAGLSPSGELLHKDQLR